MGTRTDQPKAGRLRDMAARHAGLLRSYASLLGGSVGRLVFALAYFIVLANGLGVNDFGVFAATAAVAVTLSRFVAFGFGSPTYRIATVKPRLIGTYLCGFLVLGLASLPLIALIAAVIWWLAFSHTVSALVFAGILAADILLWRMAEMLIVISNGRGRFGLGAFLTIFGSFSRMAFAFVLVTDQMDNTLENWALLYIAANALALAVAILLAWPRSRLRMAPGLWLSRMRDALGVMAAEVAFYAQGELDKVLVLALAGPRLAGIYAIVLRLVDLAAIPMRSGVVLLVQKMMREPDFMAAPQRRALAEGAIWLVSTAALLVAATALWIRPTLLGAEVAQAAPFLFLALAMPGFRNLTEYHAELLYARGQTSRRAFNLGLFAFAKALLIASFLTPRTGESELVVMMGVIFAAIWVTSLFLTYPHLGRKVRRF